MNWRIKDKFIPSKENDYKPHILREAATLGMLFLIVLTFAGTNLQSIVWIASDWMVSTILPAVIIEDTNQERAGASLVTLVENKTLDRAAQMKADDMARGSYFAHYSPDGVSPWHWFDEAGYAYVHAGENLAVHFTDSGEVVSAWMKSPLHRANIMNGNYSEIGIGTARGKYEGFDTVFVVQLFGTPAAAREVAVISDPEPEPVATFEDTTEEPALALLDTTTTASSASIALATAQPPANTEPAVAGVEESTEEVASEPTMSEVEEIVPPVDSPDEVSSLQLAQEDVSLTSDGTVVLSSYVSTSTGGVAASVDSSTSGATRPALSFVTQPHTVIQFIYILIGFFVAIVLTLSIIIEIRRQAPLQILYGVGLLSLMLILFYIHISVTTGVTIA